MIDNGYTSCETSIKELLLQSTSSKLIQSTFEPKCKIVRNFMLEDFPQVILIHTILCDINITKCDQYDSQHCNPHPNMTISIIESDFHIINTIFSTKRVNLYMNIDTTKISPILYPLTLNTTSRQIMNKIHEEQENLFDYTLENSKPLNTALKNLKTEILEK